jgi:hypothetical protein
VIEGLRRWRDEMGNTRALVVTRGVLGLVLLDSAIRAARELQRGYFGDVFHWPMIPEALVLPSKAYGALVALQFLLAGMVIFGVRARPALFASALGGAYVLACDRLQFHHNRWALACDCLLLSLAPCDRTREGPLWAARLAQVQVVIVYLASGGSKLLDPDWRGGRVLATRFALYGHNAVAMGFPRAWIDRAMQPDVSGALAATAIATELLLCVFLWPRRTRAFALWWGVMFHLTIEATSRVEGFTWLTLGMYALFAEPRIRQHAYEFDRSRARDRALAWAVRAIDWLWRFDVKPRGPGQPGDGVVVVGADGSRVTGLGAWAAVARHTPLLFPLWPPLAVGATLLRGRSGESRPGVTAP